MSEAISKKRSHRRSTVVSQRLERMRRTKIELDADRRAREQREDDALAQLAEHATIIEAIHAERDKRIAVLEQRIHQHQQHIKQLRHQAQEKIAAADRHQIGSLVALKDAGRSADQIAALADRPLKQVRRLLRDADRQQRRKRPRPSHLPQPHIGAPSGSSPADPGQETPESEPEPESAPTWARPGGSD